MSWNASDIFRAMTPDEWRMWIALFGVGSVPAEHRRRVAFENAISEIVTASDRQQGGGKVDQRDEPAAVANEHSCRRRYHRRGDRLVCRELPGEPLTPQQAAEAAGVTWTTLRLAVAVGRLAGGLTFEWIDDLKQRQGAA